MATGRPYRWKVKLLFRQTSSIYTLITSSEYVATVRGWGIFVVREYTPLRLTGRVSYCSWWRMGRTALCLAVVVLCNLVDGAVSQEFETSCFPSCVDGTARPNRNRCFIWEVDRETGECSVDNGQPLILQFTDTRMLYIYQSGHHAGYYTDNTLCVWNIVPEDECTIVTYVHLTKDFHAEDPGDGTNCHCKDHLEILHSESQSDFFCGDPSANNCPVSNCLQTGQTIVSDSPMVLKFRSDERDYAMGFSGLISLARLSRCTPGGGGLTKRQTYTPEPFEFDNVEVPITPLCETKECACTGECTVEKQGDGVEIVTEQERQTIINIIYDKGGNTAYAYANSPDTFLLRVARRAIWNLVRFNTTIPAHSQILRSQLC